MDDKSARNQDQDRFDAEFAALASSTQLSREKTERVRLDDGMIYFFLGMLYLLTGVFLSTGVTFYILAFLFFSMYSHERTRAMKRKSSQGPGQH